MQSLKTGAGSCASPRATSWTWTCDLAEGVKQITFDRVLLVSGEGGVKVGTPLVDRAKVVAEIVEPQVKGEKIHIYKLRRRKAYRRKIGHRQKYLRVRVTEIVA